MGLVFHPLVQRDINIALRFYDYEGGASLGDRFYADLNLVLTHIELSPLRFHVYSNDVRRANLKRFPYHILFRVNAEGPRILVIRHHSRNPQFGLMRK